MASKNLLLALRTAREDSRNISHGFCGKNAIPNSNNAFKAQHAVKKAFPLLSVPHPFLFLYMSDA